MVLMVMFLPIRGVRRSRRRRREGGAARGEGL